MKHTRDLMKYLTLIQTRAIHVSESMDVKAIPVRSVTNLLKKNAEFKDFLIKHTSYLPKSALPRTRWHHYINGQTKPHVCAYCGMFVEDYFKRFCSHKCSTKVKDGAKTGPKVDLVKKELEFRSALKKLRPEYSLVEYGIKRSHFKHACGEVFEAGTYDMIRPNCPAECPCLHKKIRVQTLAGLRSKYKKRASVWLPIAFGGGVTATFKHRRCKHVAELPWDRNFDLQCPTCVPNPLATQAKTHKQYVKELKLERPEYKLVGKYIDSRTKVEFKHLACGNSFLASPATLKRTGFNCPSCSQKSLGSLYEVVVNGRTFRLRGKERVAIHWILENLKIDVEKIMSDGDRDIEPVRYRRAGKTRKYLPDFYIPTKNLLIEVKDAGTCGLNSGAFFYTSMEELWKINCLKAKASIGAGYRFLMLVFNTNNERIKLPKNWWNLSHKEIQEWIADRNPNLIL